MKTNSTSWQHYVIQPHYFTPLFMQILLIRVCVYSIHLILENFLRILWVLAPFFFVCFVLVFVLFWFLFCFGFYILFWIEEAEGFLDYLWTLITCLIFFPSTSASSSSSSSSFSLSSEVDIFLFLFLAFLKRFSELFSYL